MISKINGDNMNQITIRINGTGVESFGGTVDFATYKYFEDNDIDLEEYIEEIDFGNDDSDIPEEHDFGYGGIEETDNLWHINGAYLDAHNNIEVVDADGKQIWKSSLIFEALKEYGVQVESDGDFDEIVNELPQQTAIMVGRKVANGVIFEVELEVSKDFDATKLVIYLHEDDGYDVIKRIEYDGEVIGDESSSSEGQSQEFSWFIR